MEDSEHFISIEPEKLLPVDIQTAIMTLRSFEPKIEQQTSPEVNQAWEITRRVLDPLKDYFINNGIVVTLHGSMQYHDPYNLDLDIDFFKMIDYTPNEKMFLNMDLESYFKDLNYWPNKTNFCEPNFGYINFETLSKTIKTGDDDDAFEYPGLDCASALTSVLFFPEQTSLYHQMRRRTVQLLTENPQAYGELKEVLDEAIDIRKKRRGIR